MNSSTGCHLHFEVNLLGIPVDLVSIGALEGRFGERVRREMVPVAS